MLLKCGVLLVLVVNVLCQNVLNIYEENLGTLSESVFQDVQEKTRIDKLLVRNCGIRHVLASAFQGFFNVDLLVMSLNSIECLPEDVFQGVQNVRELECHTNLLRYLPKNIFSKLRKLESLVIYNNKITKLEVGLFDNNPSLKHISIFSNKITHLEDGIFSKVNSLESLDIGGNNLHFIHKNALPSAVPTNFHNLRLWVNKLDKLVLYENVLTSLTAGNFDGNPWYCDCNLKKVFKKWKESLQPHGWAPECQAPEHLKNKPWTTLLENDFLCGPNVVHFDVESKRIPQIGDQVVLACRINIPVGDITITYKNGTNVVNHLRRYRRFPSVQYDSTEEHSWNKLTIKSVQANDAGYYKCVINGKVEKETYLIVDDPSQYEKCLANVYF